jgi:hypothetical protein
MDATGGTDVRARTHRGTAAKQVAKLQAVAVEFTVVSLITHTRAT